jgi:hypothetical protein
MSNANKRRPCLPVIGLISSTCGQPPRQGEALHGPVRDSAAVQGNIAQRREELGCPRGTRMLSEIPRRHKVPRLRASVRSALRRTALGMTKVKLSRRTARCDFNHTLTPAVTAECGYLWIGKRRSVMEGKGPAAGQWTSTQAYVGNLSGSWSSGRISCARVGAFAEQRGFASSDECQ